MKTKRLLMFTLTASVLFSGISWAAVKMPECDTGFKRMDMSSSRKGGAKASPSDATEKATDSNALYAMKDKNVEIRTEEEIEAFYKEHPFNPSQSDQWIETPDADKEKPGKLSDKSVQNALNTLNFMRYVAGIYSDVTNNEEYEAYAQAGTTLLIRAGHMTHQPQRPDGVSEAFYQQGSIGTSRSNLGGGYPNLSNAMVKGWMDDGDASNISDVGHRRWCLDPRMRETGFGHTGKYTAMYAMDGIEHRKNDYDFVQWPAQTMPVECFRGPWTVTLSTARYLVKNNDKDNIEVVLTNEKTGETYTLDNTDKNKSGEYFNLSTVGYGYGPTLIFKPDVTFSAGDEVTVSITGLKDRYGNSESIEYTVNFFHLDLDASSDGNGGDDSSSGGNGGDDSSSEGNGGGSHSSRRGSHSSRGSRLPNNVVKGNWEQEADGSWKFTDSNGEPYRNKWAMAENPFADTAIGQSPYDWFFFDDNGDMVTGWYQDGENLFYLNQNSDGTRGRMVTGWSWIPDQNGIQRCYYFNPISDGTCGKLVKNSVIDGSYVNSNGEWTVDNVVQTK